MNFFVVSQGAFESVLSGVGSREGQKSLDFWGFTKRSIEVYEWIKSPNLNSNSLKGDYTNLFAMEITGSDLPNLSKK